TSISLKMEENNDSTENPQGQGRQNQNATKCGWLRKQGGFVKTWHTRWFVLKGDQLYYYKDEDETKPLASSASSTWLLKFGHDELAS
ncbi:hypothetical protein STEG23_006541, partial [Scotinomys teguina]